MPGESLCIHCRGGRRQLFLRFDRAVDKRIRYMEDGEMEIDGIRNDTLSSPSLLIEKQRRIMADRRRTQMEHWGKQAKERMIGSNGIDLPMTPELDKIFSVQNGANVRNFLKEKDVSFARLGDFIFSESVRNQLQAKRHGATTVRHSPLMIKLGCKILRKAKGPLYALLAKAFGLPSERRLYDYRAPGTNAPDGVQFDILHQHRASFRNYFSNVEVDAWERHGSLAFDAMTIKEGLLFDFHTLNLVGVAHDAFEHDVLAMELKAWEAECSGSDGAEVAADAGLVVDSIMEESHGSGVVVDGIDGDEADPVGRSKSEASKSEASSKADGSGGSSSAAPPKLARHHLVFFLLRGIFGRNSSSSPLDTMWAAWMRVF